MTEPEVPDEPDKPTIWPFAGALAIIVLVLIAIFAFNSFTSSAPSDQQQLGTAIVGQNDALQREDYAAYAGFTCRAKQGEEQKVLAQQRDSVAKQGQRYVDDVADMNIDGDRATAKVTYSFEKSRDTKTTSDVALVREDGAWKVCPA